MDFFQFANLVACKLNTDNLVFVGRHDVYGVASHTESAWLQHHIVAFILHVHKLHVSASALKFAFQPPGQ